MRPSLRVGWAFARVGDIADIDIGFAFKSADYTAHGVRLLRGENIEPGALRWVDTRYWPEDDVSRFEHLLVRPGDLILAMDRPVVSAGLKLARATPDDCPCLLVQRVARLRGRQRTNDFLFHSLSSPAFIRHILIGGQTGTQLPHISGKRIEDFEFALAPGPEQERIVSAIESYFTRLDDAVATLSRVERNLKRYRASVLKSAVEGRLVPTEAALAKQEGRAYEPASVLLTRILTERRRRWTESGKKGKYEEPAPPDTTGLPELPEGWCWATVDQLAGFEPRSLCDGPFGSNLKSDHYTDWGPRVVRLQNIGDGVFRDERAYISEAHYHSLIRHSVQPGDLVIASLGEVLPRAAMVPESIGPAIVKADCLRFAVNQDLASGLYVMHALNSIPTRKRTEDLIHGVGRPRIGLGLLRLVAVPLPPRKEQERIVREIERLLSVTHASIAEVEHAHRRLNRLRQAILKWAFEGKLADQDSSDEPASVLLERIKAEREIPKAAKKKSRA